MRQQVEIQWFLPSLRIGGFQEEKTIFQIKIKNAGLVIGVYGDPALLSEHMKSLIMVRTSVPIPFD